MLLFSGCTKSPVNKSEKYTIKTKIKHIFAKQENLIKKIKLHELKTRHKTPEQQHNDKSKHQYHTNLKTIL